jgi:hypothetical protein
MTQEIQDEFETFHSDINELISIAYLFDNDNIVSKMKKLYRIQKHEFHFWDIR